MDTPDMDTPDVQYISDDRGDVTGVIVPILFWKEILSELETRHVLGSEVMRKRLLEALGRKEGIPFDEVLAATDLLEQTVDDIGQKAEARGATEENINRLLNR